MGRNSVPSATKKLRGTYRRDRVVRNEAKFPIPKRMPDAPVDFTDGARKMWNRLGKLMLSTGLLTEGDLLAFELMCRAYSHYDDANKHLIEKPLVEKGTRNGGSYVSPWLGVANKAHDQLFTLLKEFGLTPSERTRVMTMLKKDEVDTPDLATLLFAGVAPEDSPDQDNGPY